MKSQSNWLKGLALAQIVVTPCVWNLHGQTVPTITTQPANQTVLVGNNVTFNAAAGGTGPFSYQWQFNGTNLPNNIINTVAGNGSATYAGDSGLATSASLNQPNHLAWDAAGNLYIADSANNLIREVSTNGIITTIAGNGIATNAGDGGPAINASLNYPSGIVFDKLGNLYIADAENNRIRQLNTNGIIITVAGNGNGTFAGDGGSATNASLYLPTGVAFDSSGNLYIADHLNNRVRRVDALGIITTVAGTTFSGYSGDGHQATNAYLWSPADVMADASGNLYIADLGNNLIRKVGTNGIITTIAGNVQQAKIGQGFGNDSGDGGVATNASLASPIAVTLDLLGDLYIADSFGSRIRKVGTNGIITTVAGKGGAAYAGDGGAATNALLNFPQGVALDARGNLYIADTGNNRVREVYLFGSPTLVLTNVTATTAGSYAVVVTSVYGSVTSAVATLTVTLSNAMPQIVASGTNFGFLTNQFGFNVNMAAGQTVAVDGSTDLVHWIPLFTNSGGDNSFYFFDPVWTNFPWRFYRARVP